VTNELSILLVILACSIVVCGCAEDHGSGGDGKASVTVSEPEAKSDLSASAWTTSDDGKLSLKIVTAHAPIRADEPVWVLAELRNDSEETLTVLRPFGDQYTAEAAGFEITGPEGEVDYSGDAPSYALGSESFTYLVPGEAVLDACSTDSLQDWLQLTEANHLGLGTPGQYKICFTYRATPGHDEMARLSGRFVGEARLWTGEIRTGPVTVTKLAQIDASDTEPAISVRIPSNEYGVTLAEAAAGLRFDYDLLVTDELEGVIPFPQNSGGGSGVGPSGLMPLETITGNGQSYGLYDVGLGQPDLRPRKIEQGTYPYSFVWDGRNWGGPSDTSMPKADPFPPGTYTLRVRVKGEIETPDGRKPYDVSDTAKILLTP
jgi:hypothetical protein